MKTILGIIAFIIILIILTIGAYLSFFVITDSDTESIDESGEIRTITGTVVENVIQVPVDGNNYLVVDTDNGRLHVLYQEGGLVTPEMAAQQCNNNQVVAQSAQNIQAGDTVEIYGAVRTDEYALEVCSSSEFYITVLGDDMNQATRQVTGEVIELISDCAFDGNCAYVVETEAGEQITVIWAEGMSPICQNDPFQGGDTDIAVGDSIDSLGRVIDDTTISACGDPSYYIRKSS